MMKYLPILTLLWCSTTYGFRLGLIRIPKDESTELVYRNLGSEFGEEVQSSRAQKEVQASSRAKEDYQATFRELFHEIDLSLSLSMSMSYPPAGKYTDSPTSAPVPPIGDSVDPSKASEAPVVPPPIVPSPPASNETDASPGAGEKDSESAATSDTGSSSTSRAPQVAMISLLTVAAAAVVVAMIARKVYTSRKANAGKSLSGESDQSTQQEQSNLTTSENI